MGPQFLSPHTVPFRLTSRQATPRVTLSNHYRGSRLIISQCRSLRYPSQGSPMQVRHKANHTPLTLQCLSKLNQAQDSPTWGDHKVSRFRLTLLCLSLLNLA